MAAYHDLVRAEGTPITRLNVRVSSDSKAQISRLTARGDVERAPEHSQLSVVQIEPR